MDYANLVVRELSDAFNFDGSENENESDIFSSYYYNQLVFPGCRIFGLIDSSLNKLLATFLIRKRRIDVLGNSSFISEVDLKFVSDTFFFLFDGVNSVCFVSIRSDSWSGSTLVQRLNVSEDFVISLDRRVEDYSKRLGKQLRSDLIKYKKRLHLEFPEVSFDLLTGSDITISLFNKLIQLSEKRMTHKYQVSTHSKFKSECLFGLMDRFGSILVIRCSEQVLAGVICTRYGSDVFMHVVCHDPSFDKFRLGKLVCFASICASIGAGALRYHLLSGRYDYKSRFLGKELELDQVEVFRSVGCLVMSSPRFILGAWRNLRRMTRKYLHSQAPRSWMARVILWNISKTKRLRSFLVRSNATL